MKVIVFFKQIKAIVILGSTSGLRAEELYQLSTEDIDLEKRVVHINHDTSNGQFTKKKISRISFFNEGVKQDIADYFSFYDKNSRIKCLFNESHISRIFKDVPSHVKNLRKFFSQEWDRRGGPTSIKKILLGHSLKGDVDLMHYNCQSEADLKKIYDRVIGEQNNTGHI